MLYIGTSLIGTPMGQESVLISGVSFFQGLNCMQEMFFLREKVPLLERCPLHSGVGFRPSGFPH